MPAQSLESVIDAHYGRPPDFTFATRVPFEVTGRDPCDTIRVYRVDARPEHWHYVSSGLSSRRSQPIELTFRLARSSAPGEPSTWPLSFLQNVAGMFASHDLPVFERHMFSLNGPIATEHPTRLVAALLTVDPTLGRILVAERSVPFLQIIGITDDEYSAARRWNANGVLEILARDNPLLVTDLTRPSVIVGDVAAEVAHGTLTEGSSMAAHHVSFADVMDRGARGIRIVTGAAHASRLAESLAIRIGEGRPFELVAPTGRVVFTPSAEARFERDGDTLRIDVSPALLHELIAGLQPKRGTLHSFVLKGLSIAIEPSEIRDADGAVVETIG